MQHVTRKMWGMTTVTEVIQEIIKQTRTRTGWSQARLAREMDKDPSWVSRWEQGKPKELPPPDELRAICRISGVSMRTLFERLGYFDPEDQEPGVAYVIREDDPRKDLLDLLRDAPPLRIGAITDLASWWVRHSTKEGNAVGSAEDPRNQPHTA